jgi:xanthine/uracil/vitamin C permease (AzgA family)
VALTVAFGFFISLFFAPLIASIPPYATGPALILVGAMMMENLVDIDWADVRQSVPAFVTIVTMPLTYSIAYGVIAGLMTYICIYVCLLVIDLTFSLFSKTTTPRDVLIEATPDIFLGRIKKVDPLKSPSAVLQHHENAEHRKHHAAAADNMYVNSAVADKNVDKLPVTSSDGSSGSGDVDADAKDQA